MKKLIHSKKSQAAYVWLFGLSFLFALGIMYSVFLYVFEGQVAPIIKGVANNTLSDPVARQTVSDGIDNYMIYFKLMPFILFIVVVIYMIATSIYRQSGQTN
jgi:predicted PurR-regulated permease PerM